MRSKQNWAVVALALLFSPVEAFVMLPTTWTIPIHIAEAPRRSTPCRGPATDPFIYPSWFQIENLGSAAEIGVLFLACARRSSTWHSVCAPLLHVAHKHYKTFA